MQQMNGSKEETILDKKEKEEADACLILSGRIIFDRKSHAMPFK